MKYFVSVTVLMLVAFGAQAAQNSRLAMYNKIAAAPRATASLKQLNSVPTVNNAPTETGAAVEEIDMREAERNACLNNNVGIGNTFVWASKFSDTSDYANMVEDVNKPQNNACFVRVEIKSDDESRVVVSDLPAKYFMWGETIECGSWLDQEEVERRILDARKGARIGGIVASTVGGAGLGVGVMELIGNTSIDGWKGQKDLSGYELYRSHLLAMDESESQPIIAALKDIKQHVKDSNYTQYGISKENYEIYKKLIKEFAN